MDDLSPVLAIQHDQDNYRAQEGKNKQFDVPGNTDERQHLTLFLKAGYIHRRDLSMSAEGIFILPLDVRETVDS